MYTQCPKCETGFRVSAQVLRAASGQVRCGKCGDVFNALARLVENAADLPKGESSYELETRADAILESPPPEYAEGQGAVEPAQDEHSGLELAHLEILDTDPDLADELSLEFTLPPGELDRIFIETAPSPLQMLKIAAHPEGAHPAPLYLTPVWVEPAPGVTTAPSEAVPPIVPQAGLSPAATATATTTTTTTENALALPALSATGSAGLRISDDVREAMIAGYAPPPLPDLIKPRRQLPPGAWVATAVVLALLLLVQFLNGAEWSGSKPATPTAYQLRQWGVSGDPQAKGTLRVRASIVNASAQLQPYPLLRVALADRFGARIGQREFEPAEYLGKPANRELAPGERVDATVDIVDPGKAAEGFEIDVCLRGPHARIACAGDATSHPK